MNKKMEVLRRKQIGKSKKTLYEQVLIKSGFKKIDLNLIPLEESDKIIEKVRMIFPSVVPENEEFNSQSSDFKSSNLLYKTYCSIADESLSYIFTDDFEYCGIYLTKAKKAFKYAMNIARKDYQGTCFLLDKDFKYSIRINYYSKEHNDSPDTFDIQRKIL